MFANLRTCPNPFGKKNKPVTTAGPLIAILHLYFNKKALRLMAECFNSLIRPVLLSFSLSGKPDGFFI